MPIVMISRGSYNKGKEIAEKTAERMRCACVSREDVLKETSAKHKIPELTLARAIQNAPSLLDRIGYNKEKLIAYYGSTLLGHFQTGNIVYHGLAAHYFVQNISHVFKVRVVANFKARVLAEMERSNISRTEAERILTNDDEERRKWSQYLYGVDVMDPMNFDMVINVDDLSSDDAVDIICQTVKLPRFSITPEGRQAVENASLALAVQAVLMNSEPRALVDVKNGVVKIVSETAYTAEAAIVDRITNLVRSIPGVKDIVVDTNPTVVDC